MSDFAADKRPGTAMLNLAKGYDAAEIKMLSAHLAARPWVNTPHPASAPTAGNFAKTCQGCHGQNGEGRGTFPHIAGQHPDYLYQALGEYKTGARPSGLMKLVAKMDDATLKQLADYYSTLK